MQTTAQCRVLKKVLLESLHRYQEYSDLLESEFNDCMADYPAFLRAMADAYDTASPELMVEEKPRFKGYTDWAETYDQETNNPVIAGENRVFGKIVSHLKKDTVLDVGAGTGRHTINLARAGAHVTAVEPNDGMLTKAIEKARAEGLDIEFHSREVYDILDDERVFDLVLCCLVLSHVEDLERAFTELAGRVAPGGHLVVTDFHPVNLLVGMRTSYVHNMTKFYVPNSIHLPSKYVEIAQENGLRLISFHESGEIRDFPNMPATLVLVFNRG
ncbi:MAG: class I SAM-dependent methyltransferase [Spirochaetales bacterium]|jgi:2-polyprenyl-3-methyl-5-hydroxy-6-metoxy-1,4-benzoquinol methylase|nr:class I SAM-dependent methyltransferase [Spirochaetales bacterium]